MKKGDADNIEPHPFLGKLTGRRSLSDMTVTPASNLIAVYNEKGAIHISLETETILFDVPIELAYTVAPLQDGRFACGTGAGMIYLLRPEDGLIDQEFHCIKKLGSVIIHKAVNDICMLGKTDLAYASEDDGMAILDITNGNEKLFMQEINNPNSLSTNQPRRILSDEKGNFYVTTLYNGIDFFNLSRYFIEKKMVFEDPFQKPFVSYINSIDQDYMARYGWGHLTE